MRRECERSKLKFVEEHKHTILLKKYDVIVKEDAMLMKVKEGLGRMHKRWMLGEVEKSSLSSLGGLNQPPLAVFCL